MSGISQPQELLSEEEVKQYQEKGFVHEVQLLDAEETEELQRNYERIKQMLPEGQTLQDFAQWAHFNDYIYKLATHPRLLRHVASLIGPSFYAWDGFFFQKNPYQDIRSQWHQGWGVWPLVYKDDNKLPGPIVTVLLAIYDCTKENGCLKVIPDTARKGMMTHGLFDKPLSTYLFRREVPEEDLSEEELASVVFLESKAGHVSFQSEGTLHASDGNTSPTERAAISFRYAPYTVHYDTKIWPNFTVLPCQANYPEDAHRIHPAPTTFGYAQPDDFPHMPPKEYT
jgi:ectoine hydroxylase-related dioxygenase (phytanoyl-CoA dioxygenase family)